MIPTVLSCLLREVRQSDTLRMTDPVTDSFNVSITRPPAMNEACVKVIAHLPNQNEYILSNNN